MTAAAVELDAAVFAERLQRLRDAAWGPSDGSKGGVMRGMAALSLDGNVGDGYDVESADLAALGECDALVLSLGAPTDQTVYQKTTAMFHWLLGYEFPETVLAIPRPGSSHSAVFLCSTRKAAILETLVAAGTTSVCVIGREKTPGASATEKFEELLSHMPEREHGAIRRVGIVSRDVNEGAMIEEWAAFVSSAEASGRVSTVDVASALGVVLAVRDAPSEAATRVAARMSSLLIVDRLSKDVLQTIDDAVGAGRRVRTTHSALASRAEDFVSSGKAAAAFRGRVDAADLTAIGGGAALGQHADVCYPPIVQSGGVYSLKASAVSTDDALSATGAVIVAAGVRVRAQCANAARTLLVDPTPAMEDALGLLYSLRAALVGSRESPGILRAGRVLSDVYADASAFVARERPSLAAHLPPTLGFATGIEFRIAEYVLSAKCARVLRPGMALNLVLGLADVSSGNANFAVMLADTVIVARDGRAVLLTEGLDDVTTASFSFAHHKETTKNAPVGARARRGTVQPRADDAARREHQLALGQMRLRDALARYASAADGAADGSSDQHSVGSLPSYEAYKRHAGIPRDALALGAGGHVRAVLDRRAEALVVPVFGLAVPFHVSAIRSITKSDEGANASFLRINFVAPQATPMGHSLKALTLKVAGDPLHAQELFRGVTELKKASAEREAAARERADVIEQGPLVEIGAGRRPARLPDVAMRPAPEGSAGGGAAARRNPGDVEIHANGLRFRPQLRPEARVDVLFSNVRHMIVQPCDHETIIALHLHLHHPIMVGKKKTRDVQFFREALDSAVDDTAGGAAGGRRKMARYGDEDEIAQEAEERRRRAAANDEFRGFAAKIVEASGGTLQADEPVYELGITGVPHRQAVLLQPTVDCLVFLAEPPFFLITMADVEVAFLERVVFGLKNFDIAFVFKDHARAPALVSSVPMAQLDNVKAWLDSVDVYFVESRINFNWTNIMKTVAEDPAGFYEHGGWTYLQPDDAGGRRAAAAVGAAAVSDNEDDSDAGSSEYEPDESEEEVSEESEEYMSEGSDETESEAESEESDAPDWSDLEEDAAREDERTTTKRPAPSQRGPAPKRR